MYKKQDMKGDVYHAGSDMPGALQKMKGMVEEAKAKNASKGGKKLIMWDFRASLHAGFGKSIDDLFTAFLMWARAACAGVLGFCGWATASEVELFGSLCGDVFRIKKVTNTDASWPEHMREDSDDFVMFEMTRCVALDE